MRSLKVSIPDGVWGALEAAAAREERSLSAMACEALREWAAKRSNAAPLASDQFTDAETLYTSEDESAIRMEAWLAKLKANPNWPYALTVETERLHNEYVSRNKRRPFVIEPWMEATIAATPTYTGAPARPGFDPFASYRQARADEGESRFDNP